MGYVNSKVSTHSFSNLNEAAPFSFFFVPPNAGVTLDVYAPLFWPLPSHGLSSRRRLRREYMQLNQYGTATLWVPGDGVVVSVNNGVLYMYSVNHESYIQTLRILATIVVKDIYYQDVMAFNVRVLGAYSMYSTDTVNQMLGEIIPSKVELWYDEILDVPQSGVLSRIRRAFLTNTRTPLLEEGIPMFSKTKEEMDKLIYRPKTKFQSLEEINQWQQYTMWKIYDNYGHTNLDGFAPDDPTAIAF